MWKVLLAIAAVVLCGAAYLGFENKKSLETLHVSRVDKQEEVRKLKILLAETKEKLEAELDATQKLVQETEGLNTKITVAKGKESDYKGQIEVLSTQVAAADTMLKMGQDFMRDVPDIQARKLQMAELQNTIQEEVIAAQNLQKQTAEVNTQRDKLQGQADELQALTNDQAAGRIRGPFKSTVRKAFNNWGFVIIGAGDEQGVVNRAQLDVTRGGQPICKLLVTTVEPGECVAEIIPGSMAPGQAIHPGDDVTKTTLPAGGKPAGGGGGIDPANVPTPALPEGDMQLPADGGGLLPDAPAEPAGDMKLPPAGDDSDPFAPKAPAGAEAKPDVNSDPFK
ncbi:MAG: hypothetical protein GXP30_11460 [Verrucomicrobia bacterium]|nr:hypothetical protein [Verrucomicrobiota bacterium]